MDQRILYQLFSLNLIAEYFSQAKFYAHQQHAGRQSEATWGTMHELEAI